MEIGIKDQSMENLLVHVGQDNLGFVSQITITRKTVTEAVASDLNKTNMVSWVSLTLS